MEKIKNDFIETKINSYNEATIIGYFKKMEPFEKSLGKDLCNFTPMEILGAYSQIRYKSIYTIQMTNSVLKDYTNYCLNNNLVTDNQNHYAELGVDDIKQCVNDLIIEDSFLTREELLICIDRLNNDTDKFLMLAAFEGLSGKNYKEISDLRISDIDFKNKIAKTSLGREVKLSNRLAELAQLAHDEESYMGIKGERVRKLMPSDKIIKPYVTQLVDKEYRNGRRLYSRLKKMFEVLEMPNMTCKLLRDFGIIDTILKECRKKNIAPYDYTRNKRNLERINTQYGTKFTTGNISSYYQKYETIFNEG